MMPSIALVHSVEMVRDGGSLAAVFQGSNQSEYWLLFKLDHAISPSGEFERLGYRTPVLVERLTRIETAISWQHARIFLNQVERLLILGEDRNFQSLRVMHDHDCRWLEAMQEVVTTEGRLPSGIERFLNVSG